MAEPIFITQDLAVPPAELQYRFTRSGGPGGQNVNRTSTQVELTFDVLHSPSLNDEQRARIIRALRRRIDSGGVLHVVSHSTRSQLENREDATRRFADLLAAALKPVTPRKRTRPGRAAAEKRMESKKKRAETKRTRKRVSPNE